MTGPREVHEKDQLFAAIREMAAMIAGYYRSLREEGLDSEEALFLAASRQTDMMTSAESEEDSDG